MSIVFQIKHIEGELNVHTECIKTKRKALYSTHVINFKHYIEKEK